MFEIETQVVDRIDHTLNSLANNNLNDTMKFLTIWSLTMAVPTIITGFYGMNVEETPVSRDARCLDADFGDFCRLDCGDADYAEVPRRE